MKATSPFPHDQSYDADLVNGEIFDTDKPLPETPKVGSVAPRGPSQDNRPSLPNPVYGRYSTRDEIAFLESFGLL